MGETMRRTRVVLLRGKQSVIRLWKWMNEAVRWALWEWRFFGWGFLLPAGLLWLIPIFGANHEQTVRWTGMILQLAGFVLTLVSIDGRWRSFRPFGFLGVIADKLSRFPRFRKTGSVIGLSGRAEFAAFGGRLRASLRAGQGASVEQRLDVLERNFRSLEIEADGLGHALDAHVKSLKEDLRKEATARAKEDQMLSERMSQTLVGGIGWEVLGIVFFIIGVILSTAAQEIVIWCPAVAEWFWTMWSASMAL